jgi:sulfur carrier protein
MHRRSGVQYQAPAELSPQRRADNFAGVLVMVNDEPRTLEPGASVADLVHTLGLGPRRIAVEVNRELVPRATYAATALRDGDQVEIVHFVGGG